MGRADSIYDEQTRLLTCEEEGEDIKSNMESEIEDISVTIHNIRFFRKRFRSGKPYSPVPILIVDSVHITFGYDFFGYIPVKVN